MGQIQTWMLRGLSGMDYKIQDPSLLLDILKLSLDSAFLVNTSQDASFAERWLKVVKRLVVNYSSSGPSPTADVLHQVGAS